MPPVKRYRHSLKVSLSECELAVLSYLQEVTRVPMSEHVRQALVAYAVSHPDFDLTGFRARAEPEARTSLAGQPELLSFFERQLDMLAELRRSNETTGLPRIQGFTSKRSHFTKDD